MPLVLKVSTDGEDAIVITHAGETLVLGIKPIVEAGKATVLLTGPESFNIVRKEVLERKGAV